MFPPFFLGAVPTLVTFPLPRWGVVLWQGGCRDRFAGKPAGMGIECCRLAAGIDAPRVNIGPRVGGFTETASFPV